MPASLDPAELPQAQGATCPPKMPASTPMSDGQTLGAFGEVFILPDIAACAVRNDEPGSKIDRMRQAVMAGAPAGKG